MGALHATEHAIQSAFCDWCRLNETRYPALKLAFAVPNAAKRSVRLAARMKAEGLRAGVPDWILPVPAQNYPYGYIGLAIELKAHRTKISPAQSEYMAMLKSYGWRVELVRDDWEIAKRIVEEYLR